ncbi:MAG: penicillin-binding transpeptidase domain-containing protein [Parachlamydiales bacterium]
MPDNSAQAKVKKVLNFILLLLFLIVFRIWHLSILQKETRLKEAEKPQKRTVLEQANRGVILDRKGRLLAFNRICYRASVYYAHLKQIPSLVLEKKNNRETVRRYKRKEAVRRLAKILSSELNLDEERLEDLIYAKAALLPHVPFVIKENLSEKEFYRLKMLERSLPGLIAEIASERCYPEGAHASDLVGYTGAISAKEYQAIIAKIQNLEETIRQKQRLEGNIFVFSLPGEKGLPELQAELAELKEKAYQINDLIGKSGLEGFFEKQLRGRHGKKSFLVDINGNLLKKLESQNRAKEGKTLVSTISLELQKYAEGLLFSDEKNREGKSRIYNPKTKETLIQKQPFFKGGSIVVMNPKNAEILALASYPNFNPNDFLSSQGRQQKALGWIENPLYVQAVFDGRLPLKLPGEEKELSWPLFVDLMSAGNPRLKKALEEVLTIKKAVLLQEDAESLLYLTKTNRLASLLELLFFSRPKNLAEEELQELKAALEEKSAEAEKIQSRLAPYLESLPNNDRLFFLDLLRLSVFAPAFSDRLLQKIGDLSLSGYWNFSKKILFLEAALKALLKPLFQKIRFQEFRSVYQKDFLILKREEEKSRKRYPRPYLDYLDQIENELFKAFFEQNRLELLSAWIKDKKPLKAELLPYFSGLKAKRTLFAGPIQEVGKTLNKLDFALSCQMLKTVRSSEKLERPLLGEYSGLRKNALEKDLARLFYPKEGFGFMSSYSYKKAAAPGSLFKIVTAYSALMKQYNDLKAKNQGLEILSPLSIIDTRQTPGIVGYSPDSKHPYTRYYKGGRLPASSHPNMGKIDMLSALEQSSNVYFALLAGDFLDSPEALLKTAQKFSFGQKTGLPLPLETAGFLPQDLLTNKTGLYSFAIGQHSLEVTPIQAAVMLSAIANKGKIFQPKLLKEGPALMKRKLPLPASVRRTILEGLRRVLWGEKGSARPNTIRRLKENPSLEPEYRSLKNEFVGKTSTAELMHKPGPSPSVKADKYKDIWFGGFSFEKNFDNPELVIVVYLRYGDAGREAAPLAAQIIKKYRELKKQKKL